MAVVAAGVHAAIDPAGMGEAVVLLHRQGIHVGAQAQATRAAASAQYADYAMTPDTAMHFVAPFFEFAGHQFGGQRGVCAQFRVLVDVPTQLDKSFQVQFGRGLARALGWAKCIHQVTPDQGFRGIPPGTPG
ncbi:hypothetical protein D3C73_1124400 [compost metagenome]